MDRVNVFEEQINLFLNDVAGPVATYLETVALEEVLPDAYQALSVPNFPSGGIGAGGDDHAHWIPNPPPGPPMMRSGTLIANIFVEPPMLDERGTPVVYVISDPIGESGQHYVKDYLLPRGYRFMGENPKYIYVDETI